MSMILNQPTALQPAAYVISNFKNVTLRLKLQSGLLDQSLTQSGLEIYISEIMRPRFILQHRNLFKKDSKVISQIFVPVSSVYMQSVILTSKHSSAAASFSECAI